MRGEERGLVFDVPTLDRLLGEVDQLCVRLWAVRGWEGCDAGMELRSEEGRELLRRFEELFEDGSVRRRTRCVYEEVDTGRRERVHE